MPIRLRTMCWNIAEGCEDRKLPNDAALPRIAERIRTQNPDIVLLNEVCRRWWPWGVNQVTELARMTGLQHYHWGRTAPLGAAGFKAVAILSRHQLVDPREHPVMRGSEPTFTSFPQLVLSPPRGTPRVPSPRHATILPL